MRYTLRCPVTCKIRLLQPADYIWDELIIRFETDANNLLTHVAVTATEVDSALYACSATADHVADVLRIQQNRDEALHKRMMDALQATESFLCFYGNLEAIHWDAAEARIEAETEEEEGTLNLHSWQVWPAIDDPEVDFSGDQLKGILKQAHKCASLTTTLAFYRAGINDVRRGQNISAFFNFYFVLEGLYANGKFKTDHVKHAFASSAILKGAIQSVVAQPVPKSFGEDLSVPELLKAVRQPNDANGVIHLLVHTRGDLHHHSGTKKTPVGSPLTNERYRSLAQFTLQITRAALIEEVKQMDDSIQFV